MTFDMVVNPIQKCSFKRNRLRTGLAAASGIYGIPRERGSSAQTENGDYRTVSVRFRQFLP
ncbi:hypothetical protein [Cupriavidus campinensis]